MKLSTRARYGTRMMIELGSRYNRGPVFLKDIAKKEAISEKYLSQLVMPLKAKGLIKAFRGAHGGYVLSRPPVDINLRDIVESLEGGLDLIYCNAHASSCGRAGDCVTREVWCKLSNTIVEFLKSYSLEELIQMRDEKSAGMLTYSI